MHFLAASNKNMVVRFFYLFFSLRDGGRGLLINSFQNGQSEHEDINKCLQIVKERD